MVARILNDHCSIIYLTARWNNSGPDYSRLCEVEEEVYTMAHQMFHVLKQNTQDDLSQDFSDLDPIIIDMFSIITDMFPTLAKFETLDTQLYVWVPYVRRISEPETWDSPRWRDIFRTVQNDYFTGIPCLPDVIEIVTYAGDWTIIKPNPVSDGICVRLNIYLAELDI